MHLLERHLLESNDVHLIKEDGGFIAYKITGNECFLCEMYIMPESRGSGLCKRLIGELQEVARKSGCDIITAGIHVKHKNSEKTLPRALAVGFKTTGAHNDNLILSMGVN